MATYKTEGIILKKADLGEVDRLLTIYTANFGKLQVMARGIRKPTSKLAGHLEPFTYSRLMLALGKNRPTITDSLAIDDFSQIHSNLEKVTLTAYLTELIDKFTSEEEPDKQVFDLCQKTLTELDQDLQTSYFSLLLTYQFSLLEFLGYRPELKNCLHCQNLIRPTQNFFSPKLGGLLCANCSKYDPKALKITPNAIKVLRLFSQKDFGLIRKLKIDKKIAREIFKILNHFCQFILGEELKSARFLEKCLF